MRRTINAIVAFLIWILSIGLSLIIMDASLLLGIFAMTAFTIVILFGWVMIDDIMEDLDEEAKEKKRKKEKYKVFQYDNPEIPQWDTGKQPIKVVIKLPTHYPDNKKEKSPPSFEKILKKIVPSRKNKVSVDLESGPIFQKEYRGRDINGQTLD